MINKCVSKLKLDSQIKVPCYNDEKMTVKTYPAYIVAKVKINRYRLPDQNFTFLAASKSKYANFWHGYPEFINNKTQVHIGGFLLDVGDFSENISKYDMFYWLNNYNLFAKIRLKNEKR